jgi:hypothetical protein
MFSDQEMSECDQQIAAGTVRLEGRTDCCVMSPQLASELNSGRNCGYFETVATIDMHASGRSRRR